MIVFFDLDCLGCVYSLCALIGLGGYLSLLTVYCLLGLLCCGLYVWACVLVLCIFFDAFYCLLIAGLIACFYLDAFWVGLAVAGLVCLLFVISLFLVFTCLLLVCCLFVVLVFSFSVGLIWLLFCLLCCLLLCV